MHSPTLAELPPPPKRKTGWPWTIETPHVEHSFSDESHLSRISIITPSYNQGRFIEETIRSVLLQNYPSLEYIIIDGGSTDGSVEIIKKYEQWINYWVSEPDNGQASAINKGFKIAGGEILAWLNSDDIFAPECLLNAVSLLRKKNIGIVYGKRGIIDTDSNLVNCVKGMPFFKWQFKFKCGIPQETVFWKRRYFEQVGGLDESLHYAMDYDLWIRMSSLTTFNYIPKTMGFWREHKNSKSVLVKKEVPFDQDIENMMKEFNYVQRKNFGRVSSKVERVIYKKIYNFLLSIYNKNKFKRTFHTLYELSPKAFR